MSRSRVRAGSAFLAAALFALCALAPAPVRADAFPEVWLGTTRLAFERPELRGADIALATGDAGLQRLLTRVGAALSYQPGQRYAIVTSADRRAVTFTIGDTRVEAGGIITAAPFAPYTSGSDAYIPLESLARALYLVPVVVGDALVLQPQLGALEVRNADRTTLVTLHGGVPLSFHRSATSAGRFALTFVGVGSSLDQTRQVGAPALERIDVLSGGAARTPSTTVSFSTPPGSQRVVVTSMSPNELTLAFAPPGVMLGGSEIPLQGDAAAFATREQSPSSQGGTAPAPAVTNSTPMATVTAIDLTSAGEDAASLHVSVSGSADFEWHRLNDDRWYVDLRGATLGISPRNETPNIGGVAGLRVRQFALDPVPTVRVSLSLVSQRHIDVTPSSDGLTIAVQSQDEVADARSGSGHIGTGTAYAAAPSNGTAAESAWKFGPQSHSFPTAPVARNPRLIVLDPGHGGSDTGAIHNGLVEKEVTLDIAERLRSALTARGWLVRMTRETDTDVYAPNDSARDELQARCDIANKDGARMFVSIHANSFTSSSLNGTTTYYYKASDLPLAQFIHHHLIDTLGTKDDGVRKENFYVIHHTSMPAVLIETAFLSNPSDAELLHSPAFLQRVATAIADGVAEYVKSVPMQTSESQ